MKKIVCILLSFLMLVPHLSIYAEDGYSEWSTTPTGYPNEEKAIQYGVITPKTMSEYDTNEFSGQILPEDPTDNSWYYNEDLDFTGHHFQIKKDFGSQYQINKGDSSDLYSNANAKTLYSYDFGEPKIITKIYIDVDCWKAGDANSYCSPALEVWVDGVLVISHPQKKCNEGWPGSENLYGEDYGVGTTLIIVGQKVELKMKTASGRQYTHLLFSYVQEESIKYSHVIEWNKPADDCWRFDTPYELLDDESRGVVSKDDETIISQIPVERIVYRYPLNPTISIDKRYLYEDSTIDSIQELASAIDYNGDNITHKIVITKIEYDDTMKVVYYPDYFDPYISDIIHVTYYVKNDVGGEDTKTVKLYILRNGETVDFKIYDRYISRDFINTLEENSDWKSGEYKELLNDALNWLEGK